jgi:hypothetical protein
MPRRILRSRAYQFAVEPESAVRMQFSGRRGDNSQNTRCGLIGSADTIARSSSVFHQATTFFSMVVRQDVSARGFSNGSKARSVSALSPIKLYSIG